MKFAKIVFLAGGVWGIVLVTPLYFLFDAIGRQRGTPITYPQFFYGFLAVTMAWQFAFPRHRIGPGTIPVDDDSERGREVHLCREHGRSLH